MPAVGIDHVVMSDLPQPEVKRQGRVTQVFTQPLAGSQEHVLDDVAGIDPPAQRLVQPQSDHPPEGRAVTLPEFVRGGRVGLLNLLQKPLGFNRIWPHPSIPVQAWPAPCGLPLVFRPGGYDRPVIRTDSSVYRPVPTGDHRLRWELQFPISSELRETSLMSRLTLRFLS